MPTQEVLSQIHEEILSTTQLPMAVQFLATEIKHTGLLSSGFRRLPHYFTPFQTFVISRPKRRNRFSIDLGLLVLETRSCLPCGNADAGGAVRLSNRDPEPQSPRL